MLSYSFYKVLHVVGALLLFSGLGAMVASTIAGQVEGQGRKLASIAHGVGLLLLLVAGFGAIARLDITSPWPLWIWIKLILWLALGAAPVLIRRMKDSAALLFFLLPLLGAIAVYLAVYKPA